MLRLSKLLYFDIKKKANTKAMLALILIIPETFNQSSSYFSSVLQHTGVNQIYPLFMPTFSAARVSHWCVTSFTFFINTSTKVEAPNKILMAN